MEAMDTQSSKKNGQKNGKQPDIPDLLRQIGGMNDTIDDLITFARPNAAYAPDAPIELGVMLNNIQQKMRAVQDIIIVLEDEPPAFSTSKNELEMVLGNLISQSVDHNIESNTITVTAKIKDNISTFNIVNSSKNRVARARKEELLYPLSSSRPDIKFEVAKKTVENRGGVITAGKKESSYTVKWPIVQQHEPEG